MEYESISPKVYLGIIRPYLRDMINNHKTHEEWKIQLTVRITFISSLNTIEVCIMNSKSDNIEIMVGIETDDIINKFLKSF